MPFDLNDAELATAATACRAMAYQEGDRAKKMDNPRRADPSRAPLSDMPGWRRSSRRRGKLTRRGEHAHRRMVLTAGAGVHAVPALRRYWMRAHTIAVALSAESGGASGASASTKRHRRIVLALTADAVGRHAQLAPAHRYSL